MGISTIDDYPFLGHIQLRLVPKRKLINTDPYYIMHYMGSGGVKQTWLVILIIKPKFLYLHIMINYSGCPNQNLKMVVGFSMSLLLTP